MLTRKKSTEVVSWVFISIFILNFIGVVLLFISLELDDQLDTVIKVIAAVWGGVSILLTSLGWKKDSGALTFQDVVLLRPMKILNILILGMLLFVIYLYQKETLVELKFKNEFGEILADTTTYTLFIDDEKVNNKSRGLRHGKHTVRFTSEKYFDIVDSIYIPLFRQNRIDKLYRLRFKKGKLQFKISHPDVFLRIYPLDLSLQNQNSIRTKLIGTEFTTDSLPVGTYGYEITHNWTHPRSDSVRVKYGTITQVEETLDLRRSGIFVNIDRNFGSNSLKNDVKLFLDHQYHELQFDNMLNFFIPITDLQNHFLEIKDIKNELYFSQHFALKSAEVETLRCQLSYRPTTIVEFASSRYRGKDIYIDGERRGFMDRSEGTIVLEIFDGYRKIKVDSWERAINFPVLDHYIEID